MQQISHIPLVRLLIPFIAGIIGVIYLKPNADYVLLSFGILTVLFLIVLLIKPFNTNYQFRWIFGAFIYGCLLFAGASLTSLKYKNTSATSNLLTNTSNQLLIGEITAPTQTKAKSIKAILSVKGVKTQDSWTEGNGKVIVYLQNDSLSQQLNVGDIISFEPKLENVPQPKNPNEFDFRKYLSFHLIHQQAFLRSNNWKLVQQAPTTGIFKFANDSRKYLINSLEKLGIKDKELAVASALILGYKDSIDAQLKSAYSSAGAMHVLAVSGLHVGVIFLIFSQLFSFFEKIKHGKIIKGVLLIIILWLYAILTGLSPSVMRAATMFSFIVAAKMTGRISSFFNTLAASALVLLIYNPLLIMEVGFQLSYMAVIGIVIIQPWINDWFTIRYWLPRKIWEITAVSIAAQIATFPLGLLYFHQFPNYFMLSNLIVIPLAIGILYLGIVTLIFANVPIIGEYLALALKYIIKFLNESVYLIDSLPYSLSENIRFSIADTWLLYLFIISIICLVAYRKFKYLLFGATFIIAFLSSSLFLNYTDLDQRKIIIYNIPQFSAINFIDGNDNILVSDIKLTQNRSKLMFHVQNNWINNGVKQEKIVRLDQLIKPHLISNIFKIDNPNLFTKRNYFQFYDAKIAIIDNKFKLQRTSEKLNLDLLLITKNTKLSIKELLTLFNPNQIVIDASNSTYTSERLKEEAKVLNINCWSVLLDGAFEKDV
ncbi:MAG: ComEC/Rec2 family competence protein [Vicingaceae bacterium]|nr:ComEC/Rec2 family competence protein [Vicingaceae bacterium]